MAFCTNCGAKLPENAKFCISCGTAVSQPAVSPQETYAQPQETYEQPQETYEQPQGTYEQPQETYAQPQETYEQPQETYEQPQETYEQPQETYEQPQETYEQPQEADEQPQQPQENNAAQRPYMKLKQQYEQTEQSPYTQPQQPYTQPQQQPNTQPQQQPNTQPQQQPYGQPQQPYGQSQQPYGQPQQMAQMFYTPGSDAQNAANPAPAPKKKKKTALWIILGIVGALTLAVIIIGIILVGKYLKADMNPDLGVYRAQYAIVDDIYMDADQVYNDGFTVELLAADKCVLTVGQTNGKGEWTQDGTSLHVSGSGLDCEGTLSNGVLVLYDIMDSGIHMVLVRDGTFYTPPEVPAIPATEPTASEPAVQGTTFWEQDWYGWWLIENSGGEYAGMDDGTYWWDCCAQFVASGNGYGLLTIWDEDGSSDQTMVNAEMSIDAGITENGSLTSQSGAFWDCGIAQGEWYVDPGNENFENTITISGTYIDPSNSDNYFDYYIFLRPWGEDWSDLSDDYLPGYYEEWYLPQIEAGAPMPDSIDVG